MAIETYFKNIAAAIKQRAGTSGSLTPAQMPQAILDIPGGSTPTLITKSITQNGTYNASADNADGYSSVTVNVPSGGGGYSIPNISIRSGIQTTAPTVASFTSKGPLLKNGVMSVFNDRYCYFVQLDGAGDLLKPDFTKQWELHIKTRCSNLDTHPQSICGSARGAADCPCIDINTDGSLYFGFAINNSGFTQGITFTNSEITTINTDLEITCSWDGTTYTVNVKDGTHNITKTLVPGSSHYMVANSYWQFGGRFINANYVGTYIAIDLKSCYFENDNSVIWGSK